MKNTIIVDVARVEAHLPELITLALRGKIVIIAENENPLVQLVPVRQQPQRRIAGLNCGAMKMHDDFNDPLSDEFWLGEE
jgi:antitoxin (DNA-binding transcriptional repressor) of toxin-antitoxin stability system